MTATTMMPMAANQPSILILEDDCDLRSVLRDFLSMMGYQIYEAEDIASFRRLSSQQSVDLMLLDLNLPDGDGLDVLRNINRNCDTPVFVVSGRSDDSSRLEALEAGANDYILKPFNARELELRIRNFLRRQQQNNAAPANNGTSNGTASLSFGHWKIWPNQFRLAHANGHTVTVTRSERDLLCELIRANGELCSRRKLARAMSSPMETTSEETVTVLIYRLRKKLQQEGDGDSPIETVAGAGYRIRTMA
jgi:DNA-binding response OmpR family regulator